MKKPATIEQLETTDKVYQLRQDETRNDNDLSELLGISKVTLYTRLKKSNWKKAEIALVNNLSK
jgi:predicted DNA binding protein